MILVSVIGALAGAAAGWFISKNVSKVTGGVCPILCNPKISIPYFAFLGIIIAQEIIQ